MCSVESSSVQLISAHSSAQANRLFCSNDFTRPGSTTHKPCSAGGQTFLDGLIPLRWHQGERRRKGKQRTTKKRRRMRETRKGGEGIKKIKRVKPTRERRVEEKKLSESSNREKNEAEYQVGIIERGARDHIASTIIFSETQKTNIFGCHAALPEFDGLWYLVSFFLFLSYARYSFIFVPRLLSFSWTRTPFDVSKAERFVFTRTVASFKVFRRIYHSRHFRWFLLFVWPLGVRL